MNTHVAQTQVTRATCPYCGTGCGVLIETQQGRITGVQGDPDHPANFGRLCTKGSTLHLTAATSVQQQTRLLRPMRRAQRGEPPSPVSWDAALSEAADRFAAIIQEHGPDAVGFYGSGQLLTEDYYVLNKLVKGLIGTNNLDTNSRLCMSSAVAGYKATLGSDAPPACYEDLALAQTLFIVGSNTAYAHPILFRRIEDARRANPGMKLIVADPRRTETAEMADLFLPIQPGTDVALFHGMLHVMLAEGLIDTDYVQRHTEGFETLRTVVSNFTPEVVARLCGIPGADLITAARLFGGHTPTLSLYCQGLNQSSRGTDKNAALINLHLATGQIGRPGAGPFSLTGQPNAMGGREVGGMANLLSAHRDLRNEHDRAEVAALWGVSEVPAQPGKNAVDMFEAAARGEIKALWIACTNPAQSLPEQQLVRDALARCDYVVVQEAFATTTTADLADLLLPATTWGEKDGTVTNSERRISRVRPAVPAPGAARHDWRIAVDFARRLQGLDIGPQAELFPYDSPESIWNEHRASTRGRDLDITGLDYAMLEAGPRQWPCPADPAGGGNDDGNATALPSPRRDFGKARLYEDGIFPTADGRARFANVGYRPVAEPRDARYPFALTTGRLRDQWHGMSRTGQIARLYSHVDEARVEVHADDLARRGLADGDLVRLKSRRGEIVLRAHASSAQRPGSAFVAMHWGRNMLSNSGANALTAGQVDPHSRQPELKHAAIQMTRADLPYQALLLRTETSDEAAQRNTLLRMEALAPLLSRFAYATLSMAGRDRPALVLRIAHDAPIPDVWLAELDQLCGLDHPACIVYRDARRDITKRALIEDGLLVGMRLTGEIAAASWLREVMVERQPTAELRRWLFAPLATPPVAAKSRGRVVCNCLDVAEPDIEHAITGGADLQSLQDTLRCGTSCGSCVPELKRMLFARRQAA